MTPKLQQAVTELQKLSPHDQNKMADRILDELDELQWAKTFASAPAPLDIERLTHEDYADFPDYNDFDEEVALASA